MTGGSASPRHGSRREQVELGVFLLLIVPPIVLAAMAGGSRRAFAITAVATILHDVALTALSLFFVWTAGEPFASIGWTPRRLGREIALGVVLYLPMLAVVVVVGGLLGAAGLERPHPPSAGLVPHSLVERALASLLVVVVAVAEETIFRGYLLLRLGTVTRSTAAAVGLSTLVFAAAHSYSGPAGVVSVAVLAVVFALVYLWRRSLVAPIVLHFLQDFLGLVIAPWLALHGWLQVGLGVAFARGEELSMYQTSRIALLLGGCAMLAAVACRGDSTTGGSAQRAPASCPPARAASPCEPATLPWCGRETIADIAAKVTPSVVNVFSERKIAPPEASPHSSNPFFPFFFRGPAQNLRENPVQHERSLGSGVIVSSDGVILTNSHLVERADKVRVALHDGRELEATVVGTDPPSDVAVLRVKAEGLPALGVADSSKLRIGDLVLAVGDPFGLGQTVTMGIVSATGRANLGITDYEDFIQTDAAINPGNSGGPLVDMRGNLIGLTTAIASRSGGYQGIGFAIPSNMAVQVEDAILHHGKVMRGWLGVAVQGIDENLARSLKLEAGHGVLVADVTAGSPAAKAGIARGDVIASVDGAPMTTPAQLRNLVALAGKGKRVRLVIEHGGTPRTVDVVLGELPSDAGAPETVDQGLLGGVTVQSLDRASRNRLRVPPGLDGVLVARVTPDSPAAEMGLREGDVILQVDHTQTPTIDALRSTLQGDRRAVLLLVYRDGAVLFLSLSR